MLELDGLEKRYGAAVALDRLSLGARPGRLVGFLGPNGAGKTTAMRAVFGLVALDAGAVRWGGTPVTAADLARFGYMPEARGLYPRMPATAQLAYLARLGGLDADRAQTAASRWLDRLGLADRGDEPVRQLSLGNQQRVQLAAALVGDPELLVLDEPLAGLDPPGIDAMSAVLRDRAHAGVAVVFSSHQLDLVEQLCDDVVIVADGRHRLAGSLDEVRAAAGARRVEVRLAGGTAPVPPTGAERAETAADGTMRLRVGADADPAALLAQLSAQDTVERFAFAPPPLSEIFREAVGASVTELAHDGHAADADRAEAVDRAGAAAAGGEEVSL
jgi:ABC-2 type transport system ATP-binding protein